MSQELMFEKQTYYRMQEAFYLLSAVIEEDSFDESPYCKHTVQLLKVKKGYEADRDCFAVDHHWKQESHPQYSDCQEDLVSFFDDEIEARCFFDKTCLELADRFPEP